MEPKTTFLSLLLSLLLMFSIKPVPLLGVPLSFLAVMCFVTLFVYIWSIRRSATLLRWMQADEDLQRLRRRVHQPLVSESTFSLDTAPELAGKSFNYSTCNRK